MPYSVRYKRAASAEVEAAISRYAQPEINQASAFVKDLERTEAHLRAQPALYQQVEGEIRRAVLRRFASYDRLFPSQHRLPKGGFGNLIALSLQRKARD